MIRCYNQRNFNNFIQAIESVDNTSIFDTTNVNRSYDRLNVVLQSYHNVYFPLRRLSRRKFNDKPWITQGIKNSISHKKILYRKYINNPTNNNKSKLSSYRRVLHRIIRSAQVSHYKNILLSRQTSSKQAWSLINSLFKGKQKHRFPVNLICHEGTTYFSDFDIANALNDFFSSIGRKLSHQLDSPISPSDFLGNPNTDSIFLTTISEWEILKLIHALKDRKAPIRLGKVRMVFLLSL